MNYSLTSFSIILLTVFSLNWLSCTTDKTPEIDLTSACLEIEATYNLDIKPIIDRGCALGGCHVNGGDGPGVYTLYENIIPFIEDGSFRRTTLDQKDDPLLGMPPKWSNNGAPTELTEMELELITCWLENGYPE